MADTDAPNTTPADDDLVDVDQLGTPRRPSADAVGLLVGLGLSKASHRRLDESEAFTLSEGLADLAQAAAVLVSTRLGRTDARARMADVQAARCPVVVLAHTGGEQLAVDLMRTGATAVLAEGNELGLLALLDGSGNDSGLLDTYARHYGHTANQANGSRGHDPVTGLPDAARFDELVDELVARGETPRVGYVQLPRLAAAPLSPTALTLLRRRIATQFRQVALTFGADLFAVDTHEFAIASSALTPNQAERLGVALQEVAQTYAAADGHPLQVALGHAGAEVSEEAGMLRELAQRALHVAAVDPARRVLGAEALSIGASGATELETGTRIVAQVERHSPYGEGHGRRVAAHVGGLAHLLGFDATTRIATELAARLHDVGKIVLPPEAMVGPDGLSGELREAYRSHPVRGHAYLRISAGDTVAGAVRAQHEWWDGSGFPDGLAGEDIPMEGRLLAAAHVVDELLVGTRHLDDLASLAGTRLDPEMAPAVADVLHRTEAVPTEAA